MKSYKITLVSPQSRAQYREKSEPKIEVASTTFYKIFFHLICWLLVIYYYITHRSVDIFNIRKNPIIAEARGTFGLNSSSMILKGKQTFSTVVILFMLHTIWEVTCFTKIIFVMLYPFNKINNTNHNHPSIDQKVVGIYQKEHSLN
jgi:hypothetical protein